MTNVATSHSVTELAARRQAILDIFKDDDDEATDHKNMDLLYGVESEIEDATYETADNRRAGSLILMENHPHSWDNFQVNLFLRMQQFA